MKKALFIILFFSFAASNVHAQIPPAIANHLQYMLDSFCKKRNIKGASAAVLVPGMGIWKGASGLSYDGVPLISDMWLPIGSNTKTYTAAIILKLQEEGKLSLDDTIGKWLQNIPNVNGQITIRQMLNHTSGLYNYTNNSAFFTAMNSDYTKVYQPEDMLVFIGAPSFAPGAGWEYSNTNFLLAGLIIKKILNEPFHTTVRSKILTPQGFSNTIVFPQETPNGTVPHGWTEDNGHLIDMQATYNWENTAFLSMASSAGAIVSTAEDNVKFWDALMTGKIINSTSLSQMMTTVSIGNGASYGLGVFRYAGINGHTGYCHGGTCFGYINENFRDSVNGICITALSNQDSVYNNLLFNYVVVPMHKYLLNLPPAGITNVDEFPTMRIYPNPANNNVNIQISNLQHSSQIEVYDMTGRMVEHSVIDNGNNTIDLSSLAAGTYITRIKDNNRVLLTDKLQIVK
ncbi:MAG: serine hydrolase [Bacteroidetes bacterium]|nr:serine hydrolase [Bacteroidota bacterium]